MTATDEPLPTNRPLDAESVTALTTVLSKALRALGNAGRPVAASRLGGRAWWVLNEHCPREAERINGVMHYLARLPEESEEPTGTGRAGTDRHRSPDSERTAR